MLNYTQVALTWRALGNRQPRSDDVVAIIRQFHRDSLMTVLIRLNLALTHQNGPSQEDIIRQWLLPDAADAVLKMMRQEQMQIVFHEGQVLNAIRIALLHCPEDEGFRLETMEHFAELTRALLMLSDLMFPEGPDGGRRDAIFSTMTRGEVFRHDETYLPNTLSRCYDLFVRLPPIIKSAGALRDLRDLFHEATGLEFEDFLALAFGVLVYYDTLDPRNIANAPVGVKRSAWLSTTLIGADVRDRLWAQLSLPLHRYREELQSEWERAGEAARGRDAPVLRMPDDRVPGRLTRLRKPSIPEGPLHERHLLDHRQLAPRGRPGRLHELLRGGLRRVHSSVHAALAWAIVSHARDIRAEGDAACRRCAPKAKVARTDGVEGGPPPPPGARGRRRGRSQGVSRAGS